jgi:ribosomal protein S18 acetylase RimI-like enzyme
MNIRHYEAADREACIDIFESNTPRYFDPLELEDFNRWLDGKDRNILSYNTTKEEYFYVLEVENKIIACGGYYIPIDENRGNMVWGMVHEKFHKAGFGSALLSYRINEIKQNYPGYIISLDTTQHSFIFFEKLGFTVTAIQNNYYGENLDRYDMILKP